MINQMPDNFNWSMLASNRQPISYPFAKCHKTCVLYNYYKVCDTNERFNHKSMHSRHSMRTFLAQMLTRNSFTKMANG